MTTDKLTLVLIAIFGSVWLGDTVKGLFQRRKVAADSNVTEANATQILIAGANSLVTPLTNRLKEAEDEAVQLRRELQAVREELQNSLQELTSARYDLQQERAENRRVTQENRKLRNLLADGHAT